MEEDHFVGGPGRSPCLWSWFGIALLVDLVVDHLVGEPDGRTPCLWSHPLVGGPIVGLCFCQTQGGYLIGRPSGGGGGLSCWQTEESNGNKDLVGDQVNLIG